MRVVIVGDRSRTEMPITQLVNEILDDCKQRYSSLIVVVSSCDKGVGKVVKSRNIDKHVLGKFEFDMMTLELKHYLQKDRSRTDYTVHWIALNASLIELGDEFHILTEEYPKSSTADLLKRVRAEHRPYATYKPSETKNGPKRPTFDGGELITKEVVE